MKDWKIWIGRAGHKIYTRPTTRYAGAADIEDALRASTAAPSLRDLSRGTLPKKIKEKMFRKTVNFKAESIKRCSEKLKKTFVWKTVLKT